VRASGRREESWDGRAGRVVGGTVDSEGGEESEAFERGQGFASRLRKRGI